VLTDADNDVNGMMVPAVETVAEADRGLMALEHGLRHL
jgi:hypothetical protein